MPPVQENDLWIDDSFGRVDFKAGRHELLDDLSEDFPDEPVAPSADPPAEPVAEPVTPLAPPPAPAPVEEDEPIVIDLGNGGQAVIEKTKSKGWKGSIDVGNGGVQNFYGKTKNDLLIELFKAQANATKKIREQNRQIKLGAVTETPASTPQPVIEDTRELTADDIVDIKLKLESNPDLAMETWFQKKTGLTVTQLVKLAQDGQRAKQELETEEVNKAFVRRNPDFYADENYENFASLVAYLAKHKLGKTLTSQNQDTLYRQLVSESKWTVQNLDEAYNELLDAGLLIQKPRRAPETPSTPTPQTPAEPQRTSERIVRTETRPRASLGIQTRETTPAQPEAPKLLSAEDLENMSESDIQKHLGAFYRSVHRGRR
jgi:hypothetical protein